MEVCNSDIRGGCVIGGDGGMKRESWGLWFSEIYGGCVFKEIGGKNGVLSDWGYMFKIFWSLELCDI